MLLVCVVSTCTVVWQILRHSGDLFPDRSRGPTSTDSAAHNRNTAMADNAMHMSMQMTFEASTAVTLWLKQWHTHSRGTYFVSCVGLVALCLLHEALSAFRNQFHEDFVGKQKGSQYETFAPQTPSDREAQSPSTKRCCPSPRLLLHFPLAPNALFTPCLTTAVLHHMLPVAGL